MVSYLLRKRTTDRASYEAELGYKLKLSRCLVSKRLFLIASIYKKSLCFISLSLIFNSNKFPELDNYYVLLGGFFMVQISLGQKFLPAVCNMHAPGKFAIIKNDRTPIVSLGSHMWSIE